MKEDTYQSRTYRHWINATDLAAFTVTLKETDLYIRAVSDFHRKALRIVRKYRSQIEDYIAKAPGFSTSLEPLPVPRSAPAIVREMIQSGTTAGVGPMAAVAGAIAEAVGRALLEFSPEIIVENGGDIFLKVNRKRTVGIYAGDSPLSGKLGIDIEPGDTPLGICTSSGTVGHSLSYGRSDAVIVISESTALADAAATAIGNRVNDAADIDAAIEFGRTISGLKGIVVVKDDRTGAWGDVKLCRTAA